MAELSKTKNIHQKVFIENLKELIFNGYDTFSINYSKELLGNTDLVDITSYIIEKCLESYDFIRFNENKESLSPKIIKLSTVMLLYIRELDLISSTQFNNIKDMTAQLQFETIFQIYKQNFKYYKTQEEPKEEMPF